MPRKRDFRLEQVLQYAVSREEQKQLQLSSQLEEQRRLRDQVAALREHVEEQTEALADEGRTGGMSAHERGSALDYLAAVERVIDQHLDLVSDVELRVRETRGQLVAVLQEKQALQNLKAKHMTQLRIEDQRRDANESDEMTAVRVARAKEA